MQVTPAWGWTLQQYIALGFVLLAPILLIIPSTRWIAIVWGSGFHLIIALTMHMLLPFSLQMMGFYIFFLPRDWFFGDSRALLRTLSAIPLFSRRGGAAEQGV